MIINKLRYKVYGKLIDREIELSPGINIFIGDNEAGKSTIFDSVATLLYGFRPTNRDKHPYVNWTRNEINFSSEIFASGELFTVERSLKSVPRLAISKSSNHTVQLYHNEPLSFVSHVSESLFKAVFYLTAEDLNQFEKASYESIQEKLIFNYGTDYLNKASDVILQLEQDINVLWRKDKRGNPKINQLQNEINQLKLQRHEAEKNYGALRESMLRIQEIDTTLDQAVNDKRSYEQSIRQTRANLPIRELIERIDALNRSIYKRDEFKALDLKLLDIIENNDIKVNDSKSKLQKWQLELVKLKSDLFVYTEHDHKLLDLKIEVDSLKNALSDLIRFEHEEHTILDEHMKLNEKISAQFKILFGSEIDEGILLQLRKLPVLDLMTLFQKYIEGFEKNVEIDKRASESHGQLKKWIIAMGFVGIATTIIGFIYEPLRLLSFAGIGLLGFSMAHIKSLSSIGNSEKVDLVEIDKKIEAISLPVKFPEYVYRDESLRFFGKLEQLILLLHEADAVHEKWASLIDRQKAIESMISNVMQSKGFDTSRGTVLSLQYVLAQMDRLNEIIANESKKQVEIDLKVASIENEYIECNCLEEANRNLKTLVENFGDGDYDFGVNMIAQNTDLIRKMKVYSDELSQIHYDVEAVLNASETLLIKQEAMIFEIEILEKQLLTEKLQLNSEIQRYNEKVNLEAINSEILVAEVQLNEWIEERNQLMVLLEIIKFSDERYRLENQPDIITRVSHFMNQMTHGKYQEVLISEDNGHFDLQFVVEGEIVSTAKAFSKGTIQQLFFAYRLAVLEALDPHNQLPFILDEAFVNWDSKRFVETLKLLDTISNVRQILVFTCHQNIAAKIVEHTTSKLIEVAV